MTESKTEMDRRHFLTVLGCGGCAAVGLSSSGCTIAEVFESGAGELAFDVAEPKFAPLGAVDGVVPVEVAGRPILLIRTDENTVVALNRICTHVQCDMDPQISGRWDGEKLVCVCHDSHFDATGKVLKGPATRDLAVYPTTFETTMGVGTVVVGAAESDGANTTPEMNDPPQAGGGAQGASEMDGTLPAEFHDLSNPFAPDDADALAAGEQHWAQCSGCHGLSGEGNPAFADPKPTAFDGDNSAYDDRYLFWRIRTGGVTGPAGSIMPLYNADSLSDEQVWQVLTYLRSLGQ